MPREINAVLLTALQDNLHKIKKTYQIRNNVELAEFLDVPKGTLDYWLQGLSLPNLSTLYEVAGRLGITISQLTGELPLTEEDLKNALP